MISSKNFRFLLKSEVLREEMIFLARKCFSAKNTSRQQTPKKLKSAKNLNSTKICNWKFVLV